MTRTTIRKIAVFVCLTSFAVGGLDAQNLTPIVSAGVDANELQPAGGKSAYLIFSNLLPDHANRFNTAPFTAAPIVGRNVRGETEQWYALAFIPSEDAQAKTLSAAISYDSGTKLVTLGIYSADPISGGVGAPLPGGQGSTPDIPATGECCGLARVTLPDQGVSLNGGTMYWLVAGPDNTNGADFSGSWRLSYRASFADLVPPFPWDTEPGQWVAAEIRGNRSQARDAETSHLAVPRPSHTDSELAANVTIFTNLTRHQATLFNTASGTQLTGRSVMSQFEVWLAVPFTPRRDGHATTLSAAIGYISGTKKINLGIYSDSGGTVGALLPGGEASTTNIPSSTDCCSLTSVTLAGAGVSLVANTPYWLVASTDDASAPDFRGTWHSSNLALSAYQEPEMFINWTTFDAQWLAAEIRGTMP